MQRFLTDFDANTSMGLGYEYATLLEGNRQAGYRCRLPVKISNTERPTPCDRVLPNSKKKRIGDTRPILEATFLLPGRRTRYWFERAFPAAPYHPKEMRESAYKTLNIIVSQAPGRIVQFLQPVISIRRSPKTGNLQCLIGGSGPTWQVAHDLCSECPRHQLLPAQKRVVVSRYDSMAAHTGLGNDKQLSCQRHD